MSPRLLSSFAPLLAVALTLSACLPANDTLGPTDDANQGARDGKSDSAQQSGAETRVHKTEGASWTHMVYMLADNNLEKFALQDLAEMAQVGSSDDFHIVVLVDRANDHAEEGVLNLENFTDAKYVHVKDGELVVEQELGEVDMGDTQTLVDFVTWAVKTYPADRYALTFWDHGGSWNGGFGPDDTSYYMGQGDGVLTLEELDAGIEAARLSAGIDQFALLGFDACLMGTWELTQMARPHAEYYLASQELEPGKGWDYSYLKRIKEAPSSDPVAYGNALIEGFSMHHEEPWITLSLVDLYALVPLQEALNALADTLLDDFMSHGVTIKKSRIALKEYGNPRGRTSDINTVDLAQFVEELASREPDTYAPLRDQVLAALDGAVVHNLAGPSASEAHGMALYFPKSEYSYNPNYLMSALDPSTDHWAAFAEYYTTTQLEDPAPAFVDMSGELSQEGSELVLRGTFAENGELALGPVLDYGYVSEAGRPLLYGSQKATISDDYSTVTGRWDGTYLEMIQGEKRAPVFLSMTQDGSYIEATIPAYYRESADAITPADALILYTIDLDTDLDTVTFFVLSAEGTYGEITPQQGSQFIPYIYDASQGFTFDYLVPVHQDVSFDLSQPYGFDLVSLGKSEVVMALTVTTPKNQALTVTQRAEF